MSAILRNTLRFVGSTKCATNNSTKYLQTMPHMANRLNDLLTLNRPNYLHHQSKRLYQTLDPSNKLTYLEKSLNSGHFIVSLNGGMIKLLTDEIYGHKKDIIFPSTLNTKLNGKTIDPKSNKPRNKEEEICTFFGMNVSLNDDKLLKLQKKDIGESLILPYTITDLSGKTMESEEKKTSCNYGNLHISLDGGKLKLQIKDTGETFILSHAFHVVAYNKPPKTSNDGSIKIPSVETFRKQICNSRITSKTELGEIPTSYFKPYYKLNDRISFTNDIFDYGYQVENDDKLTVAPNEFGEMKLQFPMDVSVEGDREVIIIKNSDEFLTFNHTVNIQAYKELDENLKNEITDKKNRTSKIGKFAIQLESGDLLIEAREPHGRRTCMTQVVRIIVDLDSEVPNIVVNPRTNTSYL